ncbi:type VI secretion protein [Rubrivivax gelatinosus]|nr:type VI secretion protein [Rubrivivax gelatinosus]
MPSSADRLAASAVPLPPSQPDAGASGEDLLTLFHEGFFVVQLLRRGGVAGDGAAFRQAVLDWLAGVERTARAQDRPAEDVQLACFAFVALVDEAVLGSALPWREHWQTRPLQFELFGEQLAGERFFEHLERLRQQGRRRLAVLEVFHLCLLLGFQGRYAFEQHEALGWLTLRLGDEISQWRGGRPGFAPHWQAPDHVVHRLRRRVPPWAAALAVAGVALLAYGALHWQLTRWTEHELAARSEVLRPLPEPPHVTITLP